MIIVQLAGRVGKDPESRVTTSGQKFTTFSFATNIKKGKEESTVWWRITVWGDRFDKMMPYIKKGSALIIIGELSRAPEMYSDKEGKQQISQLELTADIIKFSPFGNPDRASQEHTPAVTRSPQSQPYQSFGQQGTPSGFNEFLGNSTMSFGTSESEEQANSEDTVPF